MYPQKNISSQSKNIYIYIFLWSDCVLILCQKDQNIVDHGRWRWQVWWPTSVLIQIHKYSPKYIQGWGIKKTFVILSLNLSYLDPSFVWLWYKGYILSAPPFMVHVVCVVTLSQTRRIKKIFKNILNWCQVERPAVAAVTSFVIWIIIKRILNWSDTGLMVVCVVMCNVCTLHTLQYYNLYLVSITDNKCANYSLGFIDLSVSVLG